MCRNLTGSTRDINLTGKVYQMLQTRREPTCKRPSVHAYCVCFTWWMPCIMKPSAVT
jgi:hypothetical protein